MDRICIDYCRSDQHRRLWIENEKISTYTLKTYESVQVASKRVPTMRVWEFHKEIFGLWVDTASLARRFFQDLHMRRTFHKFGISSREIMQMGDYCDFINLSSNLQEAIASYCTHRRIRIYLNGIFEIYFCSKSWTQGKELGWK